MQPQIPLGLIQRIAAAALLMTVAAQAADLQVLYINKVSPRTVAWWTGMVIFAPENLENIEIIYLYPIEKLEESHLIGLDYAIAKRNGSSDRLLIGRPQCNDRNDSIFDTVVVGSYLSELHKTEHEERFWTNKKEWNELMQDRQCSQ